MNIDNDYDNDGNNIVPCPICLDVYCPSKEDGKCPKEDEFVRDMEKKDTVDEIIKKIADNFLGYEFPTDMYPDGGISFEKHDAYGNVRKPVGTNLLDAMQAQEMIRAIAEEILTKALQQEGAKMHYSWWGNAHPKNTKWTLFDTEGEVHDYGSKKHCILVAHEEGWSLEIESHSKKYRGKVTIEKIPHKYLLEIAKKL